MVFIGYNRLMSEHKPILSFPDSALDERYMMACFECVRDPQLPHIELLYSVFRKVNAPHKMRARFVRLNYATGGATNQTIDTENPIEIMALFGANPTTRTIYTSLGFIID